MVVWWVPVRVQEGGRLKQRIPLFFIHWWIFYPARLNGIEEHIPGPSPRVSPRLLPISLLPYLSPTRAVNKTCPLVRLFLLLYFCRYPTPSAASSSLPPPLGLSWPLHDAEINRLMSDTAESFQELPWHWSVPCVLLIVCRLIKTPLRHIHPHPGPPLRVHLSQTKIPKAHLNPVVEIPRK